MNAALDNKQITQNQLILEKNDFPFLRGEHLVIVSHQKGSSSSKESLSLQRLSLKEEILFPKEEKKHLSYHSALKYPLNDQLSYQFSAPIYEKRSDLSFILEKTSSQVFCFPGKLEEEKLTKENAPEVIEPTICYRGTIILKKQELKACYEMSFKALSHFQIHPEITLSDLSKDDPLEDIFKDEIYSLLKPFWREKENYITIDKKRYFYLNDKWNEF